MALLDRLILKLSADSTSYERSMKKAQKTTGTFSRGASSHLKGVERQIGALRNALVAFGAITAINRQLEAIDKLAKTSDRLGITTEGLAGLRHAAELTGAGTEALDKSLEQMNKRLGEAATGTGEAKRFLELMGLEVKSLINLGPEESFQKISEGINNLGSQAEKAAAANALFGRSGMSLINTMALGEEGLKKARQEAEKYGTAISRVDAAKVEQANDDLFRAGEAIEGLWNRIVVDVAPIISRLSRWLADSTAESDGLTQSLAGVGYSLQIVALGAETAIGALKLSGHALGGLAAAAVTAAEGNTEGAKAIMDSLATDLEDRRNGLMDSLVRSYATLFSEVADQIDSKNNEFSVTKGIDLDAVANEEMLQGKLDQLDTYLSSEEERLFNATVSRADIINSAREQDLISEQKYRELLLKIYADYEAKSKDITEKSFTERQKFQALSLKGQVGDVANALIDMTQATAKSNRAMFIINQAASLASAIVNTAEAVTLNLAKYPGPLGIAMAAAAAASGAAQIAAIASTTFGGGSQAPSVVASGADTTVQDVEPISAQADEQAGRERGVTVNIYGSVVDHDAFARDVIPSITKAVNDGVEF